MSNSIMESEIDKIEWPHNKDFQTNTPTKEPKMCKEFVNKPKSPKLNDVIKQDGKRANKMPGCTQWVPRVSQPVETMGGQLWPID